VLNNYSRQNQYQANLQASSSSSSSSSCSDDLPSLPGSSNFSQCNDHLQNEYPQYPARGVPSSSGVLMIPPSMPPPRQMEYIQKHNPAGGIGGGKRTNIKNENSDDDDDRPQPKRRPRDENEDESKVERRERNREHAKRSRIRKRLLLDSLQDQLAATRSENLKLRRLVATKLPPDIAPRVLMECTTEESRFVLSFVLSMSYLPIFYFPIYPYIFLLFLSIPSFHFSTILSVLFNFYLHSSSLFLPCSSPLFLLRLLSISFRRLLLFSNGSFQLFSSRLFSLLFLLLFFALI
jgi:hypothetical protein